MLSYDVVIIVSVWAFISGLAYIRIMCDGVFTPATLVEAGYFVAQTFTTTGYGNWIPEGWTPPRTPSGLFARLSVSDNPVLAMKLASIPIMLVGAFLFAFLVAVLIDYFRLPEESPTA